MAVRDTACLYSVVRNISGDDDKFFGFLPPHGRRLDDGEEFSVWGDIMDGILRGFEKATLPQRHIEAFEAALTGDGDDDEATIEIRRLPNPILVDADTDANKMLHLNAGVLYIADPCYDASMESVSVEAG